MADIQRIRRLNPKTGRQEDYLSLRWVDPVTQKRKSAALGFVPEKEAQKAKQKKEAQVLLQYPDASHFRGAGKAEGSPPTEALPLRELLEAHYLPMFKIDHAPKTIAQEELAASWLAELIGHHRLDAINSKVVDRYRHHRLTTAAERTGRPASPTTVNIELRVLRSALKWAVEYDFFAGPLPVIKRVAAAPKHVRYLPPEEVEALIAASRPEDGNRSRDRYTFLAILLMANLGLRCGEALTREWSDVDFEEGMVRVTHKPAISWFVKGGRRRKGAERSIPMTPVVKEALRDLWMELGQPKGGWVFPAGRANDGEGPRRWISKGVTQAAKRAGLPHVHPHLLRHAWASRLAMAGVDRKALQEMGGWTDGEMLDRVYAHVTSGHLKTVMAGQGIGRADGGVVVAMTKAGSGST